MENSQVRQKIAQKRKEFEDLRRENISKMMKGKYSFFIDTAYDYEDMQTKVTGNGMSEGLIKLFGCDMESM